MWCVALYDLFLSSLLTCSLSPPPPPPPPPPLFPLTHPSFLCLMQLLRAAKKMTDIHNMETIIMDYSHYHANTFVCMTVLSI